MFTSLNNTLLLVHATEIAPIVTTDRDSEYLSVHMQFVRRAALVWCKSVHWRSYCPPSRRFDLLAVLSAAVDWVCFELDNDAFKMSLQQSYQSSSSTLLPWACFCFQFFQPRWVETEQYQNLMVLFAWLNTTFFSTFATGFIYWVLIHQELESLCHKTIGSIF